MLRHFRFKPLKEGDVLGIAAPASPFDRQKFKKALSVLGQMGFKARYRKDIFKTEGYLAGSDKRRATEINQLFADPKVKALMAVRGGYGCSRLIEHLDLKSISKNKKLLVGFSDLTVLQLYLWNKLKLPSLYGPMFVSQFGNEVSEAYVKKIARILRGEVKDLSLSFGTSQVIRKGKAHGRLMGGCLSLLVASIGTPYEVDTTDAILFFEDQGEAPYKIDRMLTQLRLAGKFKKVRGILIGQMSGTPWSAREETVFFKKIFAGFKGPLLCRMPFGHIREPVPLPIGVMATLDTIKKEVSLGALFS